MVSEVTGQLTKKVASSFGVGIQIAYRKFSRGKIKLKKKIGIAASIYGPDYVVGLL